MEMEMVLRAADAKDWVYKGEGAANLILGYCGSSPALLGKVLRVQKVPRDRTEPANTCIILSKHEVLLWGEVTELVEASSKDNLGLIFTVHVMSHFLGAKHVDGGIRVLVSTDFLESVEINVQSHRPAWRVDTTKIDTLRDAALLISDHSIFTGIPRGSVCIAVEIKPKCGFLPSSKYISEANCVKKCVTRYKMHQFLKLHHGEILKTSEYDPLDLFSRSKKRIHHAIKALFATPQNNFRVFLNGSLIFGGMGGGTDIVQSQEVKKFEDLIRATGLQIPNFLDLVGEAIFDSGVLDRLLATQNLDTLDIEGVIHAYYDIISQPCMVCKNIMDTDLLHQYSYLHSLPLEKKLKIVREYLIAATAKDCSLMISFRPREDGIMACECDSVFLKSLNQIYDYKACFIDLDIKPLEKMTYYYKLDQKIVKFYKTTLETRQSSCCSTSGDNSEKKIQYQDYQVAGLLPPPL